MAIKLSQGFQITGPNPIDTRLVLTKAEMLTINDNTIPQNYFTLCLNDEKFYVYNKSNSISAETGKFREYSPGGGISNFIIRGYYLNNKFYTDSSYTTECEKDSKYLYIDKNQNGNMYTWDGVNFIPGINIATSEVPGIMKLYSIHGQNTDGTMTQKSITDGVQSIKFALTTVADEDNDGVPENVLILDLPWD